MPPSHVLGRDTISADPRQWDDLIVVCAGNSYRGIKLADQHMAEQLSKLAPVLYVDPPRSVLRLLRSSAAGPAAKLYLEESRLARLTPVVPPGPSRRGLAAATTAVARHQIHAAVTHLGGRVRAVVSAWPLHPVFGSCNEQVRIYWAQDDFVGGAALLGLNADLLDVAERRVAAAADLIVAASPTVANTWQNRGLETVLIPYGADVAAYADVEAASPPYDVHLPRPMAGFVGQLNERTDLGLLESVADRGTSLLLIGPKKLTFEPRRFDALVQRSNVEWVGPKSFEVLPSYLRLIDVGLIPYRDSPFNRGCFPLKALEYLAAGRAVVSTDLPAIRWLATDLVVIASAPGSFADLVDKSLRQTRSSAIAARRRHFASEHSWAVRARRMHEVIMAS
jgi:teichuronic acid biosynthesis glycosyltransferase TuaH